MVVGGGRVAERKVSSLLSCGALVRVISPVLTLRLSLLVKKGKIGHIKRNYQFRDLSGALLVIAATGDEKTNSRISSQAGEELTRMKERSKVAAIGPVTARTAREWGFEVAIILWENIEFANWTLQI